MFKLDSFTVSELKALCAELGIVVGGKGNSAPKSEYVKALNQYFRAKDVADKLMGVKRDNLQKVARRLSLSSSGTKRELTEAILAKVNDGQAVSQSDAVEGESAAAETEAPSDSKGFWWACAVLIAVIVVAIWLSGGFATETPAPAVPYTPAPVLTEPVKVPDAVNHFHELGRFYVDGDPDVEGYKVQGAQMKYTCKSDFGVFITMDPGVVNGQSTGDLGAVFFVACKKGGVVAISTPHWSTSSLHQQIHLVEFTQEISENQAISFLKVLKADEGKQVAFFIDAEGKVTKY